MNWYFALIKIVWDNVSPELRDSMVNGVKELEKKAKATTNKWDDFAVIILKLVLGIA